MDSDTEHDGRPVYLNVVTLLDCTPGRADQPGTGEPISIVTLSHKGEILRPMLFNLRDTQKLAVSMLAILAHHGDAKAKHIMAEFFTADK
jgi:hypothetical protein